MPDYAELILPPWLDVTAADGSEIERLRTYHAIVDANMPYCTSPADMDRLHRQAAELCGI